MISIHAPHTGRDLDFYAVLSVHNEFQSTRPIRGATTGSPSFLTALDISIHVPHTGRDSPKFSATLKSARFQSTRPIRGATLTPSACSQRSYFNPRAPYGARPAEGPVRQDRGTDFNPRAPYGARPPWHCALGRSPPISIHAPHTGRDRHCCIQRKPQSAFQSTRPIRGATRCSYGDHLTDADFNPRAPYGARPTYSEYPGAATAAFQSTRPIRGAT